MGLWIPPPPLLLSMGHTPSLAHARACAYAHTNAHAHPFAHQTKSYSEWMWKRKANWFTGFRSADNRWNSLGHDSQGEWLRAQQPLSVVEDLGMRDYAAAVRQKLRDLPPADPATLGFGVPERPLGPFMVSSAETEGGLGSQQSTPWTHRGTGHFISQPRDTWCGSLARSPCFASGPAAALAPVQTRRIRRQPRASGLVGS